MSMDTGRVLGGRPAGIPLAAPAYGPGPYRFTGTRALMFIGATNPARAAALLPPELELVGDGIVIWTLMDCPEVTGIGSHTCACPSIPCRYGDVTGQFIPFLLTSTEASLLCFREVQGWAAVLGEAQFADEGGRVTGRITRNGRTIAEVSATVGDAVIEAVPKEPTFLYKEIPSADTAACDVSRLIATTSQIDAVRLRPGSGEMRFTTPDDPFSGLAPHIVHQTLYGTWNDVYPETVKILHDYIA